jgi:ribosomal protein S18 acetylase RimI-like enzyme
MTEGVRIRMGAPEDAGAIHAMLAELAGELGFGATVTSTEATIRSHGHGPRALFSTLIAEAEAPVGFALYFPHFSTMRGQPGLYVQDLWTTPAMRGQGLGTALLAAAAEASVRDWGAAYLALSLHHHNTVARHFYERLGFERASDDRPMFLAGPGFASLAGTRKAIA